MLNDSLIFAWLLICIDQCCILQQPKSIILSQEGNYEMKDGKMKYVLRKETFQYIPILETLKALLNNPDILTEVMLKGGFHIL